MATDTWIVKEPVLLKEVIGQEELPDGSQHYVLRGFIATRGQKIKDKELDPNFVQRYDAGDENARSLVERLGEEPEEEYDPSKHTVEEVLEYLKWVDDEESLRVMAAEESGKDRTTITSYESVGDSE